MRIHTLTIPRTIATSGPVHFVLDTRKMKLTQSRLADYAQRTVSGALVGLTIYGAVSMVVLFQNRQKRLRTIEEEMRARG